MRTEDREATGRLYYAGQNRVKLRTLPYHSRFRQSLRRLGRTTSRAIPVLPGADSTRFRPLRTALRLGVTGLGLRLRGARSEERRAAAARSVARELGRARGVWAKLGQQLAMRVDLLPDEVREPLQTLFEDAPRVPFASIQEQLARSLGPAAQLLADLDPIPIGVASVAQVHRGRLPDGTPVAVKVRHAELTPERVERDLAALRRLARPLGRWLGVGELSGAVDELALALGEELDFEREGRIAEEVARNLADDPRLLVPRVHWETTCRDVLTLDYIPRVRLDDRAALESRGLRPEECLGIIAEAYGRQIFAHGLFHADPHPGNLFAVDDDDPLSPRSGRGPGVRPRVLFLDFGLSKRLSEPLRDELRQGLRALLRRDVAALLAGLDRLGALAPGRERQAEDALRQMFEAGAAEALGADAARVGTLVQVGRRLVLESGAFCIPRDLLLYARTLAHVWALAERIAPGSDPMPHLLPHLLRFMTQPAAVRKARCGA